MVEKCQEQIKQVKRNLDSGTFHPEDGSIFDNQKKGVKQNLMQSLRNIPLREFLAKSGTLGIAGAAYLVADKIYDDLIFYSKQTDKVPLISASVVTGWEGADLKVNIISDATYKPSNYSSGGQLATETVESMQPTLSPIDFGINIRITNDMLEDKQYDLIEYHVRKAAFSMGSHATDLALTVLKTATDGWGTKNSSATGDTDQTKWIGGTTADITDAISANADDGWLSNTMAIMPQAWHHSVRETLGVLTNNADDWWKPVPMITQTSPLPDGFNFKVEILDALLSTSSVLHDATDAPDASPTTCVTIIFDRDNALLTGRKRWMRIENYADPVKDLAGATVTCRQDSVTLYNDAIYVLTEST